MPRQRVRVEVIGLEELVAKFKRKGWIEDPLLQMMEDATLIGQKAAVEAVDGGTGAAVRSISRNVGISSKGSTVTSAMRTEAIRSIDLGRKKGEADRPSVKQMERWARAVGSPVSPFKLVREVMKTGTKGKRFKAAGMKAVDEAMPDLSHQMERRVEANWKR